MYFYFNELEGVEEIATLTDAGEEVSSGDVSYDLSVPANSDAAIYDTTTNQHLYNIELLLIIVVVIMVARLSRDLFRTMFNNLLK